MTEQSKVLTLAEIEDLARRALTGCGAHGHQLDLAVQSVVDAECDGIRTVGLGYLPLYCGHLQVGKINHDARPTPIVVSRTLLLPLASLIFMRWPGRRASVRCRLSIPTRQVSWAGLCSAWQAPG